MTSPIDTITHYINKYLWPTENHSVHKEPDSVHKVAQSVHKTDEKVKAANPLRREASEGEPTWGNPYTKGNCTE